ncbi:hypothetical protein GH714_030815 [Hevea brasiliensis]|uniref:Disease resistance R13L4/SHOC-2-like LRR domain-containing protein n=1 Tax=Hevea brasiliensis TaxID=3981 RepID=A0A6A6N3N3_HEVBR|nr:hypothetical protein GH714_030815 [Hevea brasiliensis]
METFQFLWIICLLSGELICGGVAQLVHCNAAEREALLDLKMGLNDSWNRLPHGMEPIAVNAIRWEIRPSLAKLKSLKHLDLSGNNFTGKIPHFLSSLENLQYLNLSYAGFSGAIPPNLGNLSSLQFLDVSYWGLTVDNLEWGSLFKAKLPTWLANISSLVSVDIGNSMLTGRIPLGFGELPNLQSLKLNYNLKLSASCFQLFARSWKKIQILDLSINGLHGRLPTLLGNMTSLIHFDLHFNYIEGGIPSSIGKLSNLQYIDLYLNNLTGSLPDSIGQLRNLVELRLNGNLLQGSIPSSIGKLQYLTTLTLASNKLNGSLPASIGLLSELSSLDVSLNKLTGVISEAHFRRLGKLEKIDLSENSFILNVSSNWVPPFQVIFLQMGSCHLGPSFPSWLRSQKQVQVLDFRGCLEGHIPNPFNVTSYANVDLSSNQFKGPIPLPNVFLLDLSNNQFSGSIPENIGQVMSMLSFLSLSGNELTGAIPVSIGEISLDVLDLSKNNLAGSIPSSIGNCSSLTVLDLQKNNLSGGIPNSIGYVEYERKIQKTSVEKSDDIQFKIPAENEGSPTIRQQATPPNTPSPFSSTSPSTTSSSSSNSSASEDDLGNVLPYAVEGVGVPVDPLAFAGLSAWDSETNLKNGCDFIEFVTLWQTRRRSHSTSYVWKKHSHISFFCNIPLAGHWWSEWKCAVSGVGIICNFFRGGEELPAKDEIIFGK